MSKRSKKQNIFIQVKQMSKLEIQTRLLYSAGYNLVSLHCSTPLFYLPLSAAILHPHKDDTYTFIDHSLSSAFICSKYRLVISFFYVISGEFSIITYLYIHFVCELAVGSNILD